MKAVNIGFAILFLLSALLQYNDPDPYIWMPLYLLGAWLCFQASRGRYYPRVYITCIVIYSAYAVFLFFTDNGVLSWWNEHEAENIAQSMKAERPWIEQTREFFGLMLLVLALGLNLRLHLKNKTKSRPAVLKPGALANH